MMPRHLQLLRAGYPDLKFFGNTFIAYNIAQMLPNGTLVSNRRSDNEQLWRETAEQNGVRLEFVPYVGGKHVNPKDLENLIRKETRTASAPVIVNYHFPETELEAGVPQRIHGIFGRDVKQFMHLHCSSDFYLKGEHSAVRDTRTEKLREALDTGSVSKYIAVSYGVRDSFAGILPPSAIRVVHNGISEAIYDFRDEPDKMAFKQQFDVNGKLIIGYSGRLDNIKGYEDLIATMHWFDKNRAYDVGFLIATSGGAHIGCITNDLKAKAPRLLAENRVGVILDIAKFMGGIKSVNAQAVDYFDEFARMRAMRHVPIYKGITPVPMQALCDVYFHPSRTEAFGLSIAEAIFVGTPVVASRVGGVGELVSPHVGRLVDPLMPEAQRVEEYANSLVTVADRTYGSQLDMNTAPFRREARQRLIGEFGSKAMVASLAEVYAE